MKGVSAVIATILMLIITIALAGMAYMYISGFFGTATSGVELADAYCSAGVANIKIKNIGSTDIGADSIEIVRSSPASSADCVSITDQATCEANQCCLWTDPNCGLAASPPTDCLADGSTPVDCCANAITPGGTQWFKDATCGSAKSCVYRITPPVGKTVTATQYCT